MALIRNALLPEQLRTRAGEVVEHELLFLWSQRACTEVPEEPQNQMPGLSQGQPHEAALHPTQRRAAGRYSIRSGSICSPQVSQMP